MEPRERTHERHNRPSLELELDKKETHGRVKLVLKVRSDRQRFPLYSFSAAIPLHYQHGRYVLDLKNAESNVALNNGRGEVLDELTADEGFQDFVEEAVSAGTFPASKDKFYINIPDYLAVRRTSESVRGERDNGCSFYRKSSHLPPDYNV